MEIFADIMKKLSLLAKRGVTDKPNALPRTKASVIPPLATADSLSGNHSRVTLFGKQNARGDATPMRNWATSVTQYCTPSSMSCSLGPFTYSVFESFEDNAA